MERIDHVVVCTDHAVNSTDHVVICRIILGTQMNPSDAFQVFIRKVGSINNVHPRPSIEGVGTL